MKYFVMSDLHGSAYYTKKLLDIYKAGEYGKLLLLGDLLYHGPRNDLPKDYEAPDFFLKEAEAIAVDVVKFNGEKAAIKAADNKPANP